MAEKTLKTRIIQKHDTEANWLLATNFTPMNGEIIIYDEDDNHDYKRIKIGNGTDNVNDLDFYAGDWNDLKNKPFGDSIVETVVIPESAIKMEWVSVANCYAYSLKPDSYTPFINGVTYRVVWNNKICDVVAKELSNGFVYLICQFNGFTIDITGNDEYENYSFYSESELDETSAIIKVLNIEDETKQLDLKYLPKHPHSWNDLEDKPFGESNTPVETVIVSETIVYMEYVSITTCSEGILQVDNFTSIIPEKTYRVNWDGNSYDVVASASYANDGSGILSVPIGNNELNISGNSEYNRYCFDDRNGAYDGNYSFSLSIIDKEITQLNEKFIPDTIARIEDLENVNSEMNNKINAKMDKNNPVGSGSFSMNRRENSTVGSYSFTEGNNNVASGSYSHAEGSGTTASGKYSHAEGYQTGAEGDSSHAEGYGPTASGWCSHAEGNCTTASENSSHAEGFITTASGGSSHAEGSHTTASGGHSHAEGSSTTASGKSSHAEGWTTEASGDSSHAEGYDTTASGDCSHAEGHVTTAYGNYSHVEGYNTKASSQYQHVQGKWNVEDASNTYAHIVGNGGLDGTGTLVKSNAHTLDWDGNAWFAGDVYVGGTSQDDGSKLITEAKVDEKISKINIPEQDLSNYALKSEIPSIAGLATEAYADSAATQVKNDLLNGAGAAYDTLKELGDLITENVDAINALETVASGKADKEHTHSFNDLEDRPFYYEESFSEIIPETTISGITNIGSLNLIQNNTYTVIFNDVEYECVFNGNYLGNQRGYYLDDYSNGEPFYITSNGDVFAGSYPFTIKIVGVSTNLKLLDDMFISDNIQRKSFIVRVYDNIASHSMSEIFNIYHTKNNLIYLIEDDTNIYYFYGINNSLAYFTSINRGGYALEISIDDDKNVIKRISDFSPYSVNDDYYKKYEINNLLQNKADVSHSHTISDVTDLQTTLDEISEKANESDVFVVNITKNGDGTYSADKTFAEITEARESGKVITCLYDNTVMPLLAYTSSACTFQKVTHNNNVVGNTVAGITSSNFIYVTDMEHNIGNNANLTTTSKEIVGAINEVHSELDSHNHNDIYYTQTQVNTKLEGKANTTHTHDQYLTEHQDISGKADKSELFSKSYNDLTNKPTLGSLAAKNTVVKSDLDSSIQTSLNKADTALQSFTETDPTVPAWAKEATKPTYTASEVGAEPAGAANDALEAAKAYAAEKTHTHYVKDITDFKATMNQYATNIYVDSQIANMASGLGGIPQYVYKGADMVANKVIANRNHASLVIGAMTDLHTSGEDDSATSVKHACFAMNEINKNTQLDLVAVLGDIMVDHMDSVNNPGFKYVKQQLDPIVKAVPFVQLEGNHDLDEVNTSADVRRQEYYAYIGANNVDVVTDFGNEFRNYGYKDFNNKRIRVVYLNTSDVAEEGMTTHLRISDEQFNWFINTALNFSNKEGASDWQVVVLTHIPLNYTNKYLQALLQLLKDYKDKRNGSISPSGTVINYDFRNNAQTFLCHIHGHIHNFRTEWFDNVLSITVPNACFGRNNEYGTSSSYDDTVHELYGDVDKDGNQRVYAKTMATVEDTAFSVFVIDGRINNKVHVYNYGAGIHRIIDLVDKSIVEEEINHYEGEGLTPNGDFVNAVPTSTTIGSTAVYNGKGYKNDTYVSSSGGVDSSAVGYVATGVMEYPVNDVYAHEFYILGADLDVTDSKVRIGLFNAEGSVRAVLSGESAITGKFKVTQLGDQYYKLEPLYNSSGTPMIYASYGSGDGQTITGIRLSLKGIGQNLFVSMKNPIVAGLDGETVNWSAYTNVVSSSIDAEGEVFNGVGYKEGTRLNSSGAEASLARAICSGFIPYNNEDIRAYGARVENLEAGAFYVCFYNAAFEKIGVIPGREFSGSNPGLTSEMVDEKMMLTIDVSEVTNETFKGYMNDATYMRVSMSSCSGQVFVVTLNEKLILD